MSSQSWPNPVKGQPSGEKRSSLTPFGERVNVLIRPRVVVSRIFITSGSLQPTAMNLPHGDHAIAVMIWGAMTVATVASHDIGKPRTTLANGRAYDSYRWRTFDFLGDRKIAE